MTQGKQIYYHHIRENIRKMDPKLKELAIRAGAYEDGGTLLTGPMDPAVFAELIILECATVVERNLFQNIGYNTSRAVKRHFGMEDEE